MGCEMSDSMSEESKDIKSDLPLVSVIVITYNSSDYVIETLDSIKNQTYKNIEHLIIDGASTDGTVDLIKKLGLKYVSEKDSGLYDAMNKGIKKSTGYWLNFMNCGDVFYDSDVVEKCMKNINGNDLIYSDTYFSNNTIFKCDIVKNRIVHQSLVYKKNLHDEFGLYLNAKGVSISDYLFFMLCKNKKWQKVDFIISRFDLEGISSNIDHYKQKVAIDILFNQTTRIRSSILLLLHPIYNKIKRILNGK
jgi:glycosyltransferase involved in cell wall biosynthesis